MTLLPDAKIAEIEARHALYEKSDAESAAHFFDPDGFKAHLDRAALLASHRAMAERVEALEAGLRPFAELAAASPSSDDLRISISLGKCRQATHLLSGEE